MDDVLGLATFFLIWLLLSGTTEARPTLSVRGSRMLARFSYTLYVVHTPFLLLITAVVVGEGRWQPTPFNFLKACGILGVILAYAYAVASVTEFHTDAIRQWFERRWIVLRPSSLPKKTPQPLPVV